MPVLAMLCAGLVLSAHVIMAATASMPQTVPQVDLGRYVGVWYEIARMPNRFQKQCACNTTAEYAPRSDGRISVVNRCMKQSGEMDQADGVARVLEGSGNARLQVSFVSLFGIRLFWGDYWIIGLDPEYRWAIVGHPARKYGWILARTPDMSAEDKANIFALLKEQGYDPAQFQWTEHKTER